MKQLISGILLLTVGFLSVQSAWAQSQLGVVRYSHVSIPVKDLAVSIPFYNNVLGLQSVAVPAALAASQAWFNVGGGQQLRLVASRAEPANSVTPTRIALTVSSLSQTEKQLRQRSLSISRQMGSSGKPVLSISDPDGYLIELSEGKADNPGFLQSAAKSIWKSITTVE